MMLGKCDSSGSQPLLSPHGAVSRQSSVGSNPHICSNHLLSRHFCKLSKAAIVIILINIVVSATYALVMNLVMEIGYVNRWYPIGKVVFVVYTFVALVTLFYPVSGYLADVCYGRYKVILAGISLMFGAFVVYAIVGTITWIYGDSLWHWKHHLNSNNHYIKGVVFFAYTLLSIAIIPFIFGVAGYQANFIQFGLDQLLEAPSTSLALFIHWAVWAESLGTFFIQVVIAIFICKYHSSISYTLIGSSLIIMMMLLFVVLLCIRCCQFYNEPRQHNPYKMVFKVLSFAKKHKWPLHRSAFTYSGDEEPCRLDYAKERYGGPFTTEQVEDVKVFLRILLLFLSLGPIFVLDVPTSYFMFLSFSVHAIEDHTDVMGQSCSATFILLDKGSLTNLVSVLVIPVYVWIVFSFLRRHSPKIFSRLICAMILHLLGVISMLCIELAGHIVAKKNSKMDNIPSCMYVHKTHSSLLHLHWSVLLLPSVLTGMGQPLVIATAFEFISAQSPFSMKGLLIGVFFSIRAFFQLISGLALIPFTYKPLWESEHMREHPPVTSCGFDYFLFTFVVALIGLVLLSVVARKYKYRERDDRPYDQRFAVDVYDRYIAERALQDCVDK